MKTIVLFYIFLFSSTLWASIGHIMTYRGDVKLIRQNNTLNIQMGMQLEQKDKILTKKSSRVQVILDDKTVITIGSNSNFSFDKYFFDGTKKSDIKLSTTKGFFRTLTGKISKIAPQNFKLKTKSATIGIRGTDFLVKYHLKKKLLLV